MECGKLVETSLEPVAMTKRAIAVTEHMRAAGSMIVIVVKGVV